MSCVICSVSYSFNTGITVKCRVLGISESIHTKNAMLVNNERIPKAKAAVLSEGKQ